MNAIEISDMTVRKGTDVLDLAEYGSVETFMKKVFSKETPPEISSATASASLQIDAHDRTASLIERASKSIEFLAARCAILEQELEQGKADLEEQTSNIEALKDMLIELRARNAAADNELKAVTTRCQAAESRVVDLERAQKLATLRVSNAENVSNKLHQQVEAAFGQGSTTWSLMDSVDLRQAAE